MRTLIVDDHPVVREVLGAVVRGIFAEAIVAGAASLAQALEHAKSTPAPDLVLLDLGLPDCSGLEALRAFRRACPQARIVVVSATEDRTCIVDALDAGAFGYIPKTHQAPLMMAALRVVAEGGTYVPPQALRAEAAPPHLLTQRQLDVLRLMADGLGNKAIAERLRIAEDTVKQHLRAAYALLGVSSRVQALIAAARLGIPLG